MQDSRYNDHSTTRSESRVKPLRYLAEYQIRHSSLPALTRLVLCVTWQEADWYTGVLSNTTHERLATLTGMSVRAVKTHLGTAKSGGWITWVTFRDGQGKTHNTYYLTVPSAPDASLPGESKVHEVHDRRAPGAYNTIKDQSNNQSESKVHQMHFTEPAAVTGKIEDFQIEKTNSVVISGKPPEMPDQNPNLENLHVTEEKTELPSVTKIKGPWCPTCDMPYVSNVKEDHEDYCQTCRKYASGMNVGWKFHDHVRCCAACDNPIEHDMTCTACGQDRIELSFGNNGKPWYRCPSCNVYIIDSDAGLVAKTHKAS